MSTLNHIVKSDPSEGSICVDAGVGGNQGYYPSIASSLLGCDRLLLTPRYVDQGPVYLPWSKVLSVRACWR